MVSPGSLGVVLKAGSWYLVATGLGKERTFNVADVQRVALLPTSFTRPPGFDLPTYWRESLERFEERLRPHRAELVASPLGLRRIQALGTFASQAVETSLKLTEKIPILCTMVTASPFDAALHFLRLHARDRRQQSLRLARARG